MKFKRFQDNAFSAITVLLLFLFVFTSCTRASEDNPTTVSSTETNSILAEQTTTTKVEYTTNAALSQIASEVVSMLQANTPGVEEVISKYNAEHPHNTFQLVTESSSDIESQEEAFVQDIKHAMQFQMVVSATVGDKPIYRTQVLRTLANFDQFIRENEKS